AQRNALDLIRRRGRQEALAARIEPSVAREGTDDRLALLFACCHPALAPEARLALTLRAVIGLTTPQIARAFLVNEQTLAQRIVRAKRKVVSTHIDLRVPEPDELPQRLGDVLAVVYVMYNEAFVSSTGRTQDRDLGADAVWLADVIATSLPDQAEAWGLAALLTLQHGRAAARFSRNGDLVLLRDQDRSRWDHTAIKRAGEMLERAAGLHAPGPYQLQAAIAACHAEAPSWAETDWLQIVTLYGALIQRDSSPVVRLNGAIALAQLGPRQASEALADVDRLADRLGGYHLFHAARAELLRLLGRTDEAAAADRRALELTTNEAERRLIQTRLRRHPLTDGS
ncbi:MAG: RNA polymerase sigma factor, partial [Nocardioidaceae bacterium]